MKVKMKFGIGFLVVGIVTAALLSLGTAGVSRAQEGELDSTGISEDSGVDVPEVGEIVIMDEGHTPFLPTEAVKEALDTAVANNILSQEQADQILADAENSAADMGPDVIFAGGVMGEGGEGGMEIRPFGPQAQFHFRSGAPDAVFEARPGLDGEGRGMHVGGFIHALQEAVADGTLTQEAMNQILTDFAEFAGDNVTAEIPEGSEGDVFIAIEGLAEELQAAQQAALDKAVAEGVLTADQADTILQKARTLPDFPPMPHPIPRFDGESMEMPPGSGNFTFRFDGEELAAPRGRIFIERGQPFATDPLIDVLSHHLQQAVEDGKLSQAEMETLMQELTDILE